MIWLIICALCVVVPLAYHARGAAAEAKRQRELAERWRWDDAFAPLERGRRGDGEAP